MDIKLPELPFPLDGLEPYLSRDTVSTHYFKHHQAYVEKLNKLIKDTPFAGAPLDEIVKCSGGTIFNNAAQAWNHGFYWRCLREPSSKRPDGILLKMINESFGGFSHFIDRFISSGMEHFGSGWVWLSMDDDNKGLKIQATHDGATPLTEKNVHPLLTCDLWEHAYYIDFKNERAKYLEAFIQLINWDFVARQY